MMPTDKHTNPHELCSLECCIKCEYVEFKSYSPYCADKKSVILISEVSLFDHNFS